MAKAGYVFSLDIGTRNVVGIIASMDEDVLVIRDLEHREHKVRSMLDGQIHDVALVASVVEKVKEALEKRAGKKLKDVAVAVAGRALKTITSEAVMNVSLENEITERQVNMLDFLALRNALNLVGRGNASSIDFHCVGYSTLGYFLDGQPILNPVGQKGSLLKVQMIATFLPRIVIDSMLSVLNRCKLRLVNVNLEPVAAANLVVPVDMRKLNIALVDIGAGTSDIAVSRDGKIIGYGMVPMAGDEITEKLCEKYLLDFREGERVKRLLKESDEIEFRDILGNNYCLKSSEIVKEIDGEVSDLAKLIADEVVRINGGAPAAVICIGGGSQVPGIDKKIADSIGIPESRVRVISVESIVSVKDLTGKAVGPDMITPVGIALTSLKKQAFRFIDVWVNKQPVRLLALTKLKVIDALLAAGIDEDSLKVRHGASVTVEVNGEVKIFRGELGVPPKILLNGEDVSLDTPINSGDRITIKRAKKGKDALVTVYDVVKDLAMPLVVYVNGVPYEIQPTVLMDGKPVEMGEIVRDRAKLNVQRKVRVEDLLRMIRWKEAGEPIRVTVNGKVHYLPAVDVEVKVNEKSVGMKDFVGDGDRVSLSNTREKVYRVKDLVSANNEVASIRVKVNGRDIEIPYGSREIKVNGNPASLDDTVRSGDIIEIGSSVGTPILSYVLKYVDIDKKASGRLRMLVNDKDAKFTTPLHDGDRVEIFFEE